MAQGRDRPYVPRRMKVFISYPRERADDAKTWWAALGNAHEVFVCHLEAERKWPKFTSWSLSEQHGRLAETIDSAEVVVVLWDRNYGRAAWCGWELARALEGMNRRIFLEKLDSTPVPGDLLAHITVIDGTEAVVRELGRPSAGWDVRPPLGPIVLYPAASLLESRFAPRLGAKTRGLRELVAMALWLAISLTAQLALYYAVTPWMSSGLPLHLWALVTALSIATTSVGALTLSAVAAAQCGVLVLLVALPIIWALAAIGGIDEHTVVIAAAAMGTCEISCMLLLRERLLGQPLSGATHPLDRGDREQTCRGHLQAAAGTVIVGTLLSIGLELLDLSRWSDLLAKLPNLPAKLGTLIGALGGLAIAISTYRRVLGNYRTTAPFRIGIALAAGVSAGALPTAAGYGTGAIIQSYSIPALTALGGAYVGVLVGVLLAAAMAVPMAAGTSRLSVRAERRWGLTGAFIAITMIAINVQLFRFAEGDGERFTRDIVLGSLGGLAPIAILRGCSTARGRRVVARIARAVSSRRSRIFWPVAAAHVAVLLAIRAYSGPAPVIAVLQDRVDVDVEVVAPVAPPAPPAHSSVIAQLGAPASAPRPPTEVKVVPHAQTKVAQHRKPIGPSSPSLRADAMEPAAPPPEHEVAEATPASALAPKVTASSEEVPLEGSGSGHGADPSAPSGGTGGPCTPVTTCVQGGHFGRFAVKAGRTLAILARIDPRCSPRHNGWTVDGWRTSSGPEGVAGYQLPNAAMPSSWIGTLVGAFSATKVDTRGEAVRLVTIAPAAIGASATLTSPQDGFLYLIMNDLPGTYSDNDGGVWVTVDPCQ